MWLAINRRLRRCPLHRQHVLGPHDDRVKSVDTRGARVQDDHLGPMRGNGLLDIAVPDGVARHVQCFVNSKDREVISLPVFPLNASFRQACLSHPSAKRSMTSGLKAIA